MVKKYFTKYISSFLSDYIHDLDENTIEVGLLQGTLRLENINLKTKTLQKYFNYKVKSIKIESITIKCAFLSLLYKPIEINVKGITIELEKRMYFEREDFIFEKRKFLEEETEKFGKNKSMSNIAVRIFEKSSIKFERLKIIVSDEADKYELQINEVNSLSVDQNWEESIDFEDSDVFFKIFEVLQFSFAINNTSLVSPCNLECRIVVRKNNYAKENPDINIDIKVPKVKLDVSIDNYKRLIDMINCYIMQRKMRKNIKENIDYIDLYNQEGPVNQLIERFLDLKLDKTSRICQLNTQDNISEYKELYTKHLVNKISQEETDMLNKYEENNEAKVILKIREHVLTEQRLQPKRRFFFWTTTVSEEEKKTLLDNLEMDDIEHEMSTIQFTFQIKKLKMRIQAKKKTFVISYADFFTKYNSMIDLFQCTLSDFSLTCNKKFVIKSDNLDDVMKILYLNNKLSIYLNHCQFAKLYEVQKLANKILKYKIYDFEPEKINMPVDKSLFTFDVKIEKFCYVIGNNQVALSMQELNIVGNPSIFEICLQAFTVRAKDRNILSDFGMKLETAIESDKMYLRSNIDAIKFDLVNFEDSFDLILQNIGKYSQPTSNKPDTDGQMQFFVDLAIRNISVTPNIICIVDLNLNKNENDTALTAKMIAGSGVEVRNLQLTIGDIITMPEPDITIDIVKLKYNRLIRSIENIISKFENSQLSNSPASIEDNSKARKISVSQPRIKIMHYEDIYKIYIEEINQSEIINIISDFGGSKINVRNINYETTDILIDDIEGVLDYNFVYILAEVFEMLQGISVLPLNDSPRTQERSFTITNVKVHDKTITTYKYIDIFLERIRIDMFMKYIDCSLDLVLQENTNGNVANTKLMFTKSADGIQGTTELYGRIDSEFYKSIFYILNVVFDVIGHALGNFFVNTYDQSNVTWKCNADIDLYNYLNQEFLLKIVGSVTINCLLTSLFEQIKFSADTKYHYDREINMLSHRNIYEICNYQVLAYNCFDIGLEGIKGYDSQGNICAYQDTGNVKIYKHMYGMCVSINMNQVFLHTKVYKLLMIKHNFITANLSLGISNVSQEIDLDLYISKIKYKNIDIESFRITGPEITLGITTLDQYDNYNCNYMRCNENEIMRLMQNDDIKNYLDSTAQVYVNVISAIEGSIFYIKVANVHLLRGENYAEWKALVDTCINDNTYFQNNVIFDNDEFTKIYVQGENCRVEIADQYIVNARHYKVENEDTANGTLYKGTCTIEIKTFNNHILEPYVYHFEYINNNLEVSGLQTMRAIVSRDFLYEKTEFITRITNFTNISCAIYYNNEKIDISKTITIKSKDNLPFVFNFESKRENIIVEVYAETKTIQTVIDGNLYIIDVSIKNSNLKIKIFSNLIFKNYTDYEMNILIGDEHIKDKKSNDSLSLLPFEDACYCPKKKTPLFCKILIESFKNYPDTLYFYDGIDECEKLVSEIHSYNKSKFTFDHDDSFVFICADLVVVKNEGYKTFYILLYLEHFLYNATNRSFNFTFANPTHKIDKEFSIGSIQSTGDSSSIRYANKENLDTFDSLQNIVCLPYSAHFDDAILNYKDLKNELRQVDIKAKDSEDSYIELSLIDKYGIYYEPKERTLHSMPYMSSMYEIIIYPYYVIYNELSYDIKIGVIKVSTGQNMLNLPWKSDRLVIDNNFTTKNEINFNSVELFSVLKIKCKGYEPFASNDVFSHRNIFGTGSLKKTRGESGLKEMFSHYFVLQSNDNYKNIAIEMSFGSGKYKNARIVRINNANILINNTKYDFFIFSSAKAFHLKTGSSEPIHFGDNEAFYIFFNDTYGLEYLSKDNELNPECKYFKLDNNYCRIKTRLYDALHDSCCYVPISNISSKYFCMMRDEPVLFKLKIAIQGKQRVLDIAECKTWPMLIKNNTKYIAKASQQGSSRLYYINPGQTLEYCYNSLHLKKTLAISVGKVNIHLKHLDTERTKDNIKISAVDKDNQKIIQISDIRATKDNIAAIGHENEGIMNVNLVINHFAISFFDKKEIICLHARNFKLGIKIYLNNEANLIKYTLSADGLQIDDQCIDSKFPIILHPKNKDLTYLSKKPISKDDGEFMKIHLETADDTIKTIGGQAIEYYSKVINLFTFAMQEFYLQIDENMLNSFVRMFSADEKHKFILRCNDCEKIQCECIIKGVAPKKNIKIGTLHIHPIVFKFSFKKSGKMGGLYNKLLKQLIANVSDYKICLNAELLYDVDNPLESIQEIIVNHYKSQLFKNIFNVLGSLDLLGNFGSFTDTFSIGVKDLFYEPLLGIKEDDPRKFSYGLIKGGKSLVKHTVSGLSGMFLKFTRGVSKNISVATFDKKFQDYNVNTTGEYQYEDILNAPKSFLLCNASLKPVQRGLFRFVDSISSGVSGFVEQPISGASSGVKGFVKGLGKGAVGLVTKPVVGFVDMAGGVADGIKTGLDGTKLCRIQFPRHVANEDYDYGQASAYYLYLKFLSESGLEFIYGETYNNQHMIITDHCFYVFSKKNISEIKIDEIKLCDATVEYEKIKYKLSRKMAMKLDDILKDYKV